MAFCHSLGGAGFLPATRGIIVLCKYLNHGAACCSTKVHFAWRANGPIAFKDEACALCKRQTTADPTRLLRRTTQSKDLRPLHCKNMYFACECLVRLAL